MSEFGENGPEFGESPNSGPLSPNSFCETREEAFGKCFGGESKRSNGDFQAK